MNYLGVLWGEPYGQVKAFVVYLDGQQVDRIEFGENDRGFNKKLSQLITAGWELVSVLTIDDHLEAFLVRGKYK